MVLLVRDHCGFCDTQIRAAIQHQNGQILKVVRHPDGGFYMQMDDNSFAPLPSNIPGLPALIINDQIIIGKAPIKDFLLKMAIPV